MVMHPHYQISLTYLERQKCYGPAKKILFKKQLFDLEVKGQGKFGFHVDERYPKPFIQNKIFKTPDRPTFIILYWLKKRLTKP
jgi:hypothetical protein